MHCKKFGPKKKPFWKLKRDDKAGYYPHKYGSFNACQTVLKQRKSALETKKKKIKRVLTLGRKRGRSRYRKIK